MSNRRFVQLDVIPEEGLRQKDCPAPYPLFINADLVVSVEPSLLKTACFLRLASGQAYYTAKTTEEVLRLLLD